MAKGVNIINSRGQTIGRTTIKNSIFLLDRGIAKPHGKAIEMIEDDHRVSPRGLIPRKPVFINGDGFATLAAVEGLPVAGPAIRLFTGHRPAQPPKDYGEPKEISRRTVEQQRGARSIRGFLADRPRLLPGWKSAPVGAFSDARG